MLSRIILHTAVTLTGCGTHLSLLLLLLSPSEAGHAIVGALMPEYDPVAKISIIPRGGAGGLTFFAPSEERLESGLYSRSYLENQMAVALGGRLVLSPIVCLISLPLCLWQNTGLSTLLT